MAINAEEQLEAACWGPVWRGLPQTSPSAEHVALAVLSQLRSQEASSTHRAQQVEDCVHIDYMDTVSAWQQPQQASQPSKHYGGIYRVATARPGAANLTTKWVKSHRADTAEELEKLTGYEHWTAVGNNFADHFADKGRELHDVHDGEVEAYQTKHIRLNVAFLQHIGRNLALWVAREQGKLDWTARTKALAKPIRESACLDLVKHVWTWARGAWACAHCMKRPRSIQKRDAANRVPCRGPGAYWQEVYEQATLSGHQLLIFGDGKWDMWGCSICGANAQLRACKLRKACPGHMSSSSQAALWHKLTATGRHPVSGELVGHGLPIEFFIRQATVDPTLFDG